MSLETYVKQLTTWQEINEDVPEYARYHELIEELKKNKEIRDKNGKVKKERTEEEMRKE